MARYQLILCRTWKDPIFQAWSADTKLLFMWCCTNESTNPAGIYHATLKTMADECSLTTARLQAALQEAAGSYNGYSRVEHDQEHHLLWVVNFFRYQPRSPKICRSAWLTLQDFRRSPLVERFLKRYPEVRQQAHQEPPHAAR